MTTVFAVDSNNDMYIDASNNIVVLSGLQAILQACETASKAQLGEMVLQTGLGIPNFQTVWIGSPNLSLFTSYLRRTLANVSGVTEVVSLELNVSGNVLRYTATIRTPFGSGVING